MSLRVAGSIATAALRTAEVGIAVASSNVANADTEGYTRKIANQTTVDTGLTSYSVGVSSIGNSVNQYLLKSVIAQQSEVGATTITDSLLSQFQSTLGSTDSDAGVAGALADAADAMATFATTPESQSARVAVVESLEALTENLRETSSAIQDMREQADDAIGDTVESINASLNTLDDLNDQIVAGKAAGRDVSDLEDQRAAALKELAENIDVTYQVDSNGMLRVSTTSGSALLDSSVHELSYTPSSSVGADTTFGAITLNGKDITDDVSSGTLGALITLRDETLPGYQDELDALASTLKETLNDIHNEGTAVPAPQSLTGTATTAGTDAFSATGTLRLVVTDADGAAVESLDLDLSTYSTVQDVVDAINGMTNLTASVDSDGHLVLDTGDPDLGVGISGGSVGADEKGFSAYFGLNDLITGDGAANLQVSDAIAADNTLLAAGAISSATSLAVGDVALTSGDGSIASALSAAFTEDQDFPAAGGLGATSTSFAGYYGDFVQSTATDADEAATALENAEDYESALESAFSSQSGVNIDEEAAAITALEQAYKAAAQVMATLQEMFDTAVNMVN